MQGEVADTPTFQNSYYLSAVCPAGKRALGGGGGAETWGGTAGQKVGQVIRTEPTSDGTGWLVVFEKGDMTQVSAGAWVACAKVAP